jgi:16S rRNA processing protein RimM
MEYLDLGIIIGSFSLDGTLKLKSLTNHPEKRYKKGKKVFLFNAKTNEMTQLSIASYRSSGQFDLVKVVGIDTKEKADELRGCLFRVEKDIKDLEEGHYFFSDLVGCQIIDENEKVLGVVSQVEEFPSAITLRVRRNGEKDFFVPFLNEFVTKVDILKKKIHIQVMEGML